MNIIEFRCDQRFGSLLAKFRQTSTEAFPVNDDNLIELACSSCRTRLGREGDKPSLVLHRFDLLGALIETEVVA